jgi:hypothetical protein
MHPSSTSFSANSFFWAVIRDWHTPPNYWVSGASAINDSDAIVQWAIVADTTSTWYSALAVISAGTSIAAILTAIFADTHTLAGARARAGACTYADPCARASLSTYTAADVGPSSLRSL